MWSRFGPLFCVNLFGNCLSHHQIAHVDVCLTGTSTKGRGRSSVPVVGTLIAVSQQLHLRLLYLLWVKVGAVLRSRLLHIVQDFRLRAIADYEDLLVLI